jgi:vesicle coat complex subunit
LTKNIGVFEISDNVYLKTKYLMAYFEGARRGEMRELHEALNSRSLDDKKTALKKVIAQMTVGKDLSDLFQPVIKCLEFNDLEIKKLVCIKATQVYLYVINYSRTKPDDAIMCINLFRKDALNKGNPLLRALAVRTMSCLRVPKLNEYLIEPLKLALSDTDPYVRKTAVLSVPKVY